MQTGTVEPLMRAAVDPLFREGQPLGWGVPATGVLVETLFDRGTDVDVAEAETAIERLAAAPAEEGLVIRDVCLLQLRLRRAHRVGRGDAPTDRLPGGQLAKFGRSLRRPLPANAASYIRLLAAPYNTITFGVSRAAARADFEPQCR
jgi:hypothetical protein